MKMKLKILLWLGVSIIGTVLADEENPTTKVPCTGTKEEHSDCRGNCDSHCTDPPDKDCPDLCVPGCVCQLGYARDGSGMCVLKKNCPTLQKACSGTREVWSQCNGACDRFCDTSKQTECPTCTPGCVCEDGYARDDSKECVLVESCPVTTTPTKATSTEATPTPEDTSASTTDTSTATEACSGTREVWSQCNGACDRFCDMSKQTECPTCTPGCVCKDGYARDDSKECVLVESCPVTTTPTKATSTEATPTPEDTSASTTDTSTATARECQDVSCPVQCPDGNSYEKVKGNDGCIQKCLCRKHTKEEACQIANCQKGFKCSVAVENCRPGRSCPGPTGTCVKDPSCPELDCADCPKGYSYEEERDKSGCITKCRCRPHSVIEACRIANCSLGSTCSIIQPDCIPGEPCPGPVGKCSTEKSPCRPISCPSCLKGYKLMKMQDRSAAGCLINCWCQELSQEEACQLANCGHNQVCVVAVSDCRRRAQCPGPVAHCESCPQKQCTCSELEQLSEHTDDNGCVQCQCNLRQNAEPVCNRNCPLGSKCVFRNVQCVTTPCEPTQECEGCDPVSCFKDCEHGLMQDDQGCVICECKPALSTTESTTTTTTTPTTSPTTTGDPCSLADCKPDKPVCVVREWDCDPEWGHCPKPKAVCIASHESDNCPPKDCPMDCGVEYIIEDDCPVCMCTTVPYDPCKYIGPCQDGSVCEIMPPPCEGVGCVNFARCTRVARNCPRASLPCLAEMTCDGGFVVDQDGCKTCRCRPCLAICPPGKTCAFEEGNCEQEPCLPKQICTDIDCPPLGCPPCPEYMIRDLKPDENGCQTSCACKEKYPTCKTHVCGPQQICKMVKQRCSQFALECPKVPICKDIPCPGNNEVFSQCMGHCDRNCGDQENKICTMQCQPGCICQEGYARNDRRECIMEEYCPKDTGPKSCPGNEIRRCTAGPCYMEPTCFHRYPRWNDELPCSSACYAQCLCKKGYIRSHPNEQCIPRSWCP